MGARRESKRENVQLQRVTTNYLPSTLSCRDLSRALSFLKSCQLFMVVICAEVKKVYFAIHMCDNSGNAIHYSCSCNQISLWGKKLRTSVFQTLSGKKKKTVPLLLYCGTVKFSSKLFHGNTEYQSLCLCHMSWRLKGLSETSSLSLHL